MGELPSDMDFDTKSDDSSSHKIGTFIMFPVIAIIMGILLILLFLYKVRNIYKIMIIAQ